MSTMTQPPPPTLRSAAWLDRTDGWLALGLLLLAGLYTISFARSSLHPYEDAAMLMRYSEHLAQGHGIVWNVGEKPVDGATDFLVMVLVAGLVKAGLGVESATRLLGFLSHLVTVLVIYWSLRRLQGRGEACRSFPRCIWRLDRRRCISRRALRPRSSPCSSASPGASPSKSSKATTRFDGPCCLHGRRCSWDSRGRKAFFSLS